MTAPLRFAGYAALFDLPDGVRDTIMRGAFAKTLSARKAPVPLYWQHNPDQQIGIVEKLSEDSRGLRVIARIDNPDGRAARELLSQAASGLSFGYRARGYHRDEGGRTLTDIDLFEISLVSHPLQDQARVHLVT